VSRPAGTRGRRARSPGEGPRGTAWDRALRLLAVRDRSRREIELRLLRAGFEREEVEGTIERLASAGLLDDERFARAMAEHELLVRHKGVRAATGVLLARGVARDVAERAVEEVGGDDASRVDELATSRARRLAGLDPGVAARRLQSFLMRRGYDPGTAAQAAARALEAEPPEA
jgi:regulatory protein